MLSMGRILKGPFSCNIQVLVAESSVIHPSWEGAQQQDFDIALVKLAQPSIQPVPHMLFDHFSILTGQKVHAIGWGSKEDGTGLGIPLFGSLPSTEVQEVIEAKNCNRTTLWNGRIGSNLICGLTETRRSSCLGEPASWFWMPRRPEDSTAGHGQNVLRQKARKNTLEFLTGPEN